MEEREITRRIVGVLTRAQDLERDPEDPNNDAAVIGELLTECIPQILIDRSWSDAQLAQEVNRQLDTPLQLIAAAFASAFIQLAEYHDAGRTDVSSADVLRELALQNEDDAESSE
ncbi:hypothetical protein ABZV61_36055 [Streptomyces sp900116325]|uniref:MftR C-terminal domain-containing protein n=1 Tax=Streptomyces sp. 900116325 TaxID=3154295 RepID=A0ABV2UJP9_9ACTN